MRYFAIAMMMWGALTTAQAQYLFLETQPGISAIEETTYREKGDSLVAVTRIESEYDSLGRLQKRQTNLNTTQWFTYSGDTVLQENQLGAYGHYRLQVRAERNGNRTIFYARILPAETGEEPVIVREVPGELYAPSEPPVSEAAMQEILREFPLEMEGPAGLLQIQVRQSYPEREDLVRRVATYEPSGETTYHLRMLRELTPVEGEQYLEQRYDYSADSGGLIPGGRNLLDRHEFPFQVLPLAGEEPISLNRVEYRYDERGNWVERTMYIGGKFDYRTVRMIDYRE